MHLLARIDVLLEGPVDYLIEFEGNRETIMAVIKIGQAAGIKPTIVSKDLDNHPYAIYKFPGRESAQEFLETLEMSPEWQHVKPPKISRGRFSW